MKKYTSFAFRMAVLSLAGLSACTSSAPETTSPPWPMVTPPVAKIIPKELVAHGDKRIDNYYWLRERENPEVIAYLTAENAYTDTILSPVKQFKADLFTEFKSRIEEKDQSAPVFDNGYWYYQRFNEGQEYGINVRKKGTLEAAEEILLDENERAKGLSYYDLGDLEVSPNNRLLAFSEDTVSRRNYTLMVKDLSTGQVLPDRIPNTTGGAVWAADNQTLFYTKRDEKTLRSHQVWRHKLGTDVKQDVLVFEEKDASYYFGCLGTKSRKYILLYSSSTTNSEIQFIPADKPDAKPQVFFPREKDHLYSIEDGGDRWYVRSNWQARNFRAFEVAYGAESNRENWKALTEARENVLVEEVEPFRNWLTIFERKDGLKQCRIINRQDGSEHYLNFGEATYSASTSANLELDTDVFRYSYTSLTTPNSVFDYNMKTREKTLVKERVVKGGFDKTQYVTERLMIKARDGALVPVSLVYKKGTDKAKAPLFQYAYGSYGASMDPYFSSTRLSLLNRGFVYALCHIRGGEDLGRQWYEDGKLLKKKNTFTDFIDCTEDLIAQGYGTQGHVYAQGGSAGGLLMGAIANMRPDLYRGVLAAVPFVDVVTTMLDETIPLTTNEYDEWGNPNNKTYYEYMKSYSPYDNVTDQAYPHLLVTTGLHDSQVQYWEPAKWVAKLRTMKSNPNLVLLRTNMEAGHGGASGRFSALKEVAEEYAFVFMLEGITK